MGLQDLFAQAYALAETKQEEYLTPEGQSGIQFLKDIQIFNPNRLIFFSGAEDVTSIAIKGFQNIPEDESKKYMTKIGSNVSLISELYFFWASMTDDFPNLPALAKPLSSTLNSADAERSFSIFNLILSPRRRSLRPTIHPEGMLSIVQDMCARHSALFLHTIHRVVHRFRKF